MRFVCKQIPRSLDARQRDVCLVRYDHVPVAIKLVIHQQRRRGIPRGLDQPGESSGRVQVLIHVVPALGLQVADLDLLCDPGDKTRLTQL